MLKSLGSSGLRFLWIALLVFLADWGSKELANNYLSLYDPQPVMPFFNLTLAYNTGAAFSFLDYAALWPNVLFSVIAAAVSFGIVIWLSQLPRAERMMSVGLALVLGGALGNLWDRVHYNHVIDFLDFYVSHWHWPVFNVADIAVSLGALLIAWHWMLLKK